MARKGLPAIVAVKEHMQNELQAAQFGRATRYQSARREGTKFFDTAGLLRAHIRV